MRILLDTNVLIAAYISHGACTELFEHVATEHELITSKPLLDEFRDNLTRKFDFTAREAAQAAANLLLKAAIVSPEAVAKSACRDPDDLLVLGTAKAGRCRCIVTGDKDLLVLKQCQGIVILPPAGFWRFEEEAGEAWPCE